MKKLVTKSVLQEPESCANQGGAENTENFVVQLVGKCIRGVKLPNLENMALARPRDTDTDIYMVKVIGDGHGLKVSRIT